jgi:hypothetical protein
MIVYREQRRRVRVAELQARIAFARDPVERLIESGELAAGLADEMESAPGAPAPDTVTVSVPEGFAYYALYPEMYRLAARRFWEDARPPRAVVIGIRSIGATLGEVVAATLRSCGCEVESCTVRPRGHPWNRELTLAPELERRWCALRAAHFAVVDEGPGLSGSSFACVAECLSTLGIPDDRIVLFPAWDPDPSALLSETARRRWPRHRKYLSRFEDMNLFPGARDLSAGNWRALLFTNERDYPAVQPQHERRKYLRDGTLYKFAGLGRYGVATLHRACRLASAGFAPAVEGLENGFLATRWCPGRPLSARAVDSGLLEMMARYLAFRRAEFPADTAADLTEMIRINAAEALGPQCLERLAALRRPDAPACAIDGRMLPHEWLHTPAGWVKTDATDHHDDHFYPGPQDIACDLAAAMIEFELTRAQSARLISEYTALSGDRTILARLSFHRLGWLAFRLGYTGMAAAALPSAHPDAGRFKILRTRYTALLRQEIANHDRA